jgi:hypothetical protein
MSHSHKDQGADDRAVGDRPATRRGQALFLAERHQPADLRQTVSVLAQSTMLTNSLFDAPNHRLGACVGQGASCAVAKLDIVDAFHHRRSGLAQVCRMITSAGLVGALRQRR